MTLQHLLTTFFIFSQLLLVGHESSKTYLFVGCFTDGQKADGIFVYDFNPASGELEEVEIEGGLVNSSFLTISPNGDYLYACTDTRLEKHGSVSAFRIDKLSGKLEFINKQPAGGRNPVHVIVDAQNEYVINSNYTDPSISIFKFNDDGSLNPYAQLIEFEGSSIIPDRQEKSHIHSSFLSPDNQYLFAPDLGADRIRVLSFDREKLLSVSNELEIITKAGSGPRHFTFHPNGKFGYSIEELSGNVSAYAYENGKLIFQDSYFSYSQESNTYGSADIHISPDGKFLYASNRTDDNTISIFEINQKNGDLTFIDHQSTFGDHPRSFVIDPSGKFLIVANMNSGSIIVFKRNEKSGLLTKTNTEIELNLPASLKMRTYELN